MKDASQYPVTQGFGYDPNYQGNPQHFHNGIDYGAPEGTPIVVNGVTIGLVGHTGKVYDQNGQNTIHAAHLHVGKWINSVVQNPGVGNGFKFDNAVVTTVSEDDINGKFVRITGDNFSWVYLHMSDNSKVRVGQVLKGEDNMPDFNEGDRVNINRSLYGSDKGYHKDQIGKPYKNAVEDLLGSQQFLTEQFVNEGDLVNIANKTGWPKEEAVKGWLWKRFWYDHASNKVALEHQQTLSDFEPYSSSGNPELFVKVNKE